MIKIKNDQCCCCGACQSLRFSMPVIKTIDGCDYYEDPRPEDREFVSKIMADCWSQAITYVDKFPG